MGHTVAAMGARCCIKWRHTVVANGEGTLLQQMETLATNKDTSAANRDTSAAYVGKLLLQMEAHCFGKLLQ